jgi:acetylcholinesterase
MRPCRYDGGEIVSRSIALGQPVIYVSMNYRYVSSSAFDDYYLNRHNTSVWQVRRLFSNEISPSQGKQTGFGFLASQEVKDAKVGNLGLQDRMSKSKLGNNYPT